MTYTGMCNNCEKKKKKRDIEVTLLQKARSIHHYLGQFKIYIFFLLGDAPIRSIPITDLLIMVNIKDKNKKNAAGTLIEVEVWKDI